MEPTQPRQSRIIVALRRAFQAVEAEKGARLRPVGLHAAHFSLMINIAESPGLSGAVLARTLGVTPQNVASLAARLQASGLIERRPHRRHEHIQELYLTARGEEVIAAADAIVAGLEADIARVLGEEDAAHLRRILGRLLTDLPTEKAPVASR
jgi:DNA-binding MarR family transcriptional regulator